MPSGELQAIASRKPRGGRRMRNVDVLVKCRGRSDTREGLRTTSFCDRFVRDQDRENPTAMSLKS